MVSLKKQPWVATKYIVVKTGNGYIITLIEIVYILKPNKAFFIIIIKSALMHFPIQL